MIVYTEHCEGELPILPGCYYRHFKGNLYKVIGVAEHSETGEKLVVYQAQKEGFPIYARPLDMFAGKLDPEVYPDVKQKFRFELVKEIGW